MVEDEDILKDINQEESIDKEQVEKHLSVMGYLWEAVNTKLTGDSICFGCKKKLDFSQGDIQIREASKVSKGSIAFVALCNECIPEEKEENKEEE